MIRAMFDATARSLDDRALIEMTLAGRNDCFDVLMDRHLWVIRKRINSMISNKAEAEDVLQAAQLKVWTGLPCGSRTSMANSQSSVNAAGL